jgi:dienelactone hydrolase
MWLSATLDVINPASAAAPLLIGAAGILIAALAAGLVILAISIAQRAPLYFRWAILSGAVLLAGSYSLVNLAGPVLLGLMASTLAISALAGGTIAVVTTGKWRESGKFGQLATALLTTIGVGGVVAAGFWLGSSGPPRAELLDERPRAVAPTLSALPDPASPGCYAVKTATYGAGSDNHRPEFAGQAQILTKSVDGSKVLKGWKGFTGWARTKLWGFDAKSLPLNGRVWYPVGQGPFPLVLIVHGNHLASDFSDPGYEYLGDLLASRGYIFVSVDENFLNSMVTDVAGGLDKENNARGWLLLEHLRVWHDWNSSHENPFFGKVDIERIALVGHSRGGEAVAHAATFNRVSHNPDNAAAPFGYDYRIRSIVAIAPADGQYRPAGMRTQLENVNYFAIQGSHDSDVSSFAGLNQFDRVKFTDGKSWFKSAVYVYAANHGQFNSLWGNFDTGVGFAKRLVNTGALLDANQQRRIAMAYISAFLDCTLRDVSKYRRLFQDSRCGSQWLPGTRYVTQYFDSGMKLLCAFDEDIDLSSTTVAGGKITGHNLTLWREDCVKLRDGPNEDRAVFLGWDHDHQAGQPSYEIVWPTPAFELSDESVLSMCLADADADPTPDDPESGAKVEIREAKKQQQPIDFTIELTDADGHAARLPLGDFRRLHRQIETPYFKSTALHWDPLSEPIFQTFLLPLSDFQIANPDFNPASTVKLGLVFDRTRSGVVILDRAAFGSLK